MDQRRSKLSEILSKRVTTSKLITSAFLCAVLAPASHAQVMLQGFYWDVPSQGAGSAGAPWWWDHLGEQAQSFAQAGFSAVWIPPVLKGASGGYSDGYDPFDDYDIGSKLQMGTVPTRYGTRQKLEKCCAMMRANGLNIYCDLVENHRDGDPGNYVFQYTNAYGTANAGRFPKGYDDFHPNVAQDPDVPDGDGENFNAFGRDLAPINGSPTNQVFNGLNAAGNWLTQALDLQGYRLDDVPGISTDWLLPFLNYSSMAGKFAVGEYYDSNLSNVQTWEQNSMQGRVSAFDYPLRDGYLKDMCNNPSTFNMASLDHAGLAGVDPYHAVTFVENHDTDRSEPIVTNKMLAYAYILTSEGYPCVFYKDYSTDSGCYGLKTPIQKLMWIHEKIASGTTIQRWKNNLVFVYERLGGNHLLVGLNNNTGYNYNLTCATGFGPHVKLHDYSGHCPDVTTDANGNVNLSLPVATAGAGNGYCCYSVENITGTFTPKTYATTQLYQGAIDLDIKPADNTQLVEVGQIWVAAGTPITGKLFYNVQGWTAPTYIYVELDNSNGVAVKSQNYYQNTTQGAPLTFTASTTGWYTFKIRSYNTPASNLKPGYGLQVTYTCSKT